VENLRYFPLDPGREMRDYPALMANTFRYSSNPSFSRPSVLFRDLGMRVQIRTSLYGCDSLQHAIVLHEREHHLAGLSERGE
jgi:hypothetical protein